MKVVTLPRVEVIAAFRQSKKQAERDCLFGCAEQVESYLDLLEQMQPGDMIVIGENVEVLA